MSSDQDKEKSSAEEHLKNIKQEETEDSTEYYAQGDSKETFDEESELTKPVPQLEKAAEEMSLLKAIAYLGFGLATLAIVFILFFIRDLEHRVGGVDSALNALEEKMAPLRKEVKEGLELVNTDINRLKVKIEDRDNRAAVIELKRALVAIKGMGSSDSPKVQEKSNEVITSIQALLGEFVDGESPEGGAPTQVFSGEVKVEEAPLIELPNVEPETEELPPIAQPKEADLVTETEALSLNDKAENATVNAEPLNSEKDNVVGGEEDEGEEDEEGEEGEEDEEGEGEEGEEDEEDE